MNRLVLKGLLVGVHKKSLVGHMIGSEVGLAGVYRKSLVGHMIGSGVGLVGVRRKSLVGRMIDSEVDLVEGHKKWKVEAHKQALGALGEARMTVSEVHRLVLGEGHRQVSVV